MTSVSGNESAAQNPRGGVLMTRQPHEVPCIPGCDGEHGSDLAEGVKYCTATLGVIFPVDRASNPVVVRAVRLVDLLDTTGAADEPECIEIAGNRFDMVEARALARRIMERTEPHRFG
ncbi:hypothetical protein SAMN05216207_107816 [Pseudonocardia ammonioxydans]|uniref:Uncharacterized protein n=1 Tax=Pseudonocardia ammonioxydans TaxID=260086 RepID=A0A1I5HYA7_PSUAM|nr:hypothetical protein [Pseudonocardia ammonioxydans]SFO52781.1 hypothetical protein SAMN05216207_107816 [Pseudonocardia ammonioxydans]